MPSAAAHETLYRLLSILKHIPREPARTTVRRLLDALDLPRTPANERKIQRDLILLSRAFPLVSSGKEGEAQGWAFLKEAAAFSFPSPSLEAYISTDLSLRYLRDAMPPFVGEELALLLPKVDDAIRKQDSKGVVDVWKNRVRYIPSHFQLQPPHVDVGIKNTVIRGLLESKKLRIKYWGMNKLAEVPIDISVQGLVCKPPVFYVIALAFRYRKARAYALHRITSAELLCDPANVLSHFSLDEFIEQGGISVGEGTPEKIVLAVDNSLIRFLAETPLSEDQMIEEIDEETMRLSATVLPSRVFINWLTSVADNVQVLEPNWIREEIAGILQRACDAYARRKLEKVG